ncbi:MAG: TraR/DksA C4-type zinc finger protein, partial [Acidimicrobiia bacterium]
QSVPVKKPGAKKAASAKSTAKKPAKSTKKPVAKTSKKPAATKKAAAKKPAAPARKTPAKKTAPAKAKPAPKPKKQPAGKFCPLSGIFVPKQSPNISPKTLEKLRELLIEERARHLHQAVELQADADLLVSEREQGDTQFDEESGEGDTISVERERDLMLSANARQAVEEIDRALERMDNGTYGVCVPAGRRIAVARLEAIPWAEFCVDCKQRVERPRR